MSIIDEIILNRKLQFQKQILSYTDDQIKLINKSLDKTKKEIIKHLEIKGQNIKSWDKQRSIRLLSEIEGLTQATQNDLGEYISKISGSVGSKTLDAENSILSFDGSVVGFNDVSLSANQYKELVVNTPIGGRLLQKDLKNGTESWINRAFTKTLQEDIQGEILSEMIKGDSYVAIVDRLQSGFEFTKKEAATLARTYIQSANVGAMQAVYDENSDIVKKVRWNATLEISISRTKKGKRTGKGTCIICAGLDGREFPKDSHPECPQHPNCFIDSQVPIYTSKGNKPIGKIKIDDLVLTHKGRFKKVTQLIKTPKQKSKVIKIFTSKNLKPLTLTEDHPIMINGQWKLAKEVRVNDKLTIRANRCKRCNKKTQFNLEYCSRSCLSKDTTDKQWANPEHRKNISKKAKKRMKREYTEGTRDRFKITKKANEKVKELCRNGKFILQQPYIIQMTIDRNKNDLNKRFSSFIRMKKFNPMKNPEFRKKAIKSFKKTMLKNPDRNGNRVMALKGLFASKWEKEFDDLIKTFDVIYDRQYPILNYFVDFAIPDLKIAIEIDGSQHNTKIGKEKDNIRQNKIEKEGWMVIRFSSKLLKNNINEVKNELIRVLKNHNGEYEFMDVSVTDIKKWTLKKSRTLYNFSVEEDESYIANGYVVHNCKCFLTPVTISWRELGLDIDEIENTYRPWTHRSEKSDILKGGRILGQGNTNFTFDKFYEKQNDKFQTDVVGPNRQKLLDKNKIEFKDLILIKKDMSVKIRTLSELEKLIKK